MYTKVLVGLFTKTSVFTYYNFTIKQSANKVLIMYIRTYTLKQCLLQDSRFVYLAIVYALCCTFNLLWQENVASYLIQAKEPK